MSSTNNYEKPTSIVVEYRLETMIAASTPTTFGDGSTSGIDDIYDF